MKQWCPVSGSFQQRLWNIYSFNIYLGSALPGGSLAKNPPANTGDVGSISGLGRSPGTGSGNPLQYSCLKNPTDRGAWRVTGHRVTKRWMWLSAHTHNSARHWRESPGAARPLLEGIKPTRVTGAGDRPVPKLALPLPHLCMRSKGTDQVINISVCSRAFLVQERCQSRSLVKSTNH